MRGGDFSVEEQKTAQHKFQLDKHFICWGGLPMIAVHTYKRAIETQNRKRARVIMSDTMGTKEASDLWGYSRETIRKWCQQGKIESADQDSVGSPWHIPKDAKCPRPIKKKDQEE